MAVDKFNLFAFFIISHEVYKSIKNCQIKPLYSHYKIAEEDKVDASGNAIENHNAYHLFVTLDNQFSN